MIEWELHDRIKKIYKKARKLQRWGKSTTFAQCGEVWKPEWAKTTGTALHRTHRRKEFSLRVPSPRVSVL